MLAYLEHGHLQSRIESWATAATLKKIEYSYPLLDRRIVEFVLGLPPETFVHNGFKRYLFRSAVEKLLPDEIIWTETKMEPMRVKRLLTYKLAACKRILGSKEAVKNKSRYINTEKLVNYTAKFNSEEMNKDSLMMIVNIEASLLVMQSFTLH
jgi:asparagine synthase (glutamine-hydrolysing)